MNEQEQTGEFTVILRPRGRMPRSIQAWLEANDDCQWQMCVCHCGRWYHGMDYLAPYHTENNWCPRCEGGTNKHLPATKP